MKIIWLVSLVIPLVLCQATTAGATAGAVDAPDHTVRPGPSSLHYA